MNNSNYADDTGEQTAPDWAMIQKKMEEMQLLGAIAHQAYIDTEYLASLYDKVSSFYGILFKGQTILKTECISTTFHITTAIESIKKYQQEFLSANTEEAQEDNLYFREKTVSGLTENIATADTRLINIKPALEASFDLATTQNYRDDLIKENTETDLLKSTLESRIEESETAKTVLSEGMQILEKTNFSDIAKDASLNIENISALGLAAPEAELIRLAIDQIKKTLDAASETLNYLSMLKEQEKLTKKITDLKTEKTKINNTISHTNKKIKLIDTAHELHSNFSQVKTEFYKIITSVNAFHQPLKSMSNDREQAETFILETGPDLVSHLKTTQKQ